MDDPPPYHLDIAGLEDEVDTAADPTGVRGRPWIGIHFDCCGAYSRVYRNAEGTAYRGRCPQCLRTVRLRVGPEGTDVRFFEAR